MLQFRTMHAGAEGASPRSTFTRQKDSCSTSGRMIRASPGSDGFCGATVWMSSPNCGTCSSAT
jgi:hypothetical protein